jgi:hypothetical protein
MGPTPGPTPVRGLGLEASFAASIDLDPAVANARLEAARQGDPLGIPCAQVAHHRLDVVRTEATPAPRSRAPQPPQRAAPDRGRQVEERSAVNAPSTCRNRARREPLEHAVVLAQELGRAREPALDPRD